MSTIDNSRIVRHVLEDLIPGRDVDEAERHVTADFVDHDPFPGSPRGRASMGYTIERLHETHADLRIVVDAILAAGDIVAVRWTIHAMDATGFGLGPPTGKAFRQVGMAWLRLRRGLIEERWASIDRLAALEDLGLVPGRATPPAMRAGR